MIDWIVDAVSIEIQRLWTCETSRTHPDGVDLGEAALLWVVVAIDGVVEAGGGATIVGSESFIRWTGPATGWWRLIQGSAERQRSLFEVSCVLRICYQPGA